MSWRALYRPAGRRGARVYWRRRVFAFGALFVAVLGLYWAVAHNGAPQPAGAAVYAVASPLPSSASPSPSASPPGAALPAPPTGPGVSAGPPAPGSQPTTGPAASDTAAPTPLGAPDVATPAEAAAVGCQDRDFSVRVAPSALRVNRGGDVSFTLVVSARGLAPCDIAGLTRTVQVVSGSGAAWSSARCGSPAAGPTVVRPGAPVTFQVSWNTRSCGSGTSGPVGPGSYDVLGRVGDVTAFGGTVAVS